MRQPEPVAEHPGHFPAGDVHDGQHADGPGDPAGDGRGAPQWRVGRRDRACQRTQQLTLRAEHDREQVLRRELDVVEDLRAHVDVGGAPDVQQQAGVKGVRQRCAVDAQRLADAHREDRAGRSTREALG